MWKRYLYSDMSGTYSSFVYVPERFQTSTPLPLVVMLHGCTQTATDFARGTSMNLLAEQCGFAVLYPQQAITANYRRCWNWFLPENQRRGSGEPARIVNIIKSISQYIAPWSIDPARIYVAGLSSGASMAIILGATYPDIFAAIGVHSGLVYQAATSVRSAFQAMKYGVADPLQQGYLAYRVMGNFSRVVPSIVFHGTGDATVVPENGDQVVQQWMLTNQLASGNTYTADFHHPTRVISGESEYGLPYKIARWHAAGGEEIQAYWKISGMGHTWSGGHPTGSHTDQRGPGASRAMYTFFMAHSLYREERQMSVCQRTSPYYPPDSSA